MLKSTHKPSSAPAGLPEGWTEHKAPSGHTYYHNTHTGASTYSRPDPPPDPAAAFLQQQQQQAIPQLSNPVVANAFLAQIRGSQQQQQQQSRPPRDSRPKPQPRDRPVSKVAIPGCEPWVLVSTKCGRRFAHNPVKNASFWRIPDKLKPAILELDQARIRAKVEAEMEGGVKSAEQQAKPEQKQAQSRGDRAHDGHGGDGGGGDDDDSEYEEVEVEVTDNEEEAEDGQRSPKRRRTVAAESPDDERPLEFGEDDIAFQLAAMNAAGDTADYEDEDWREEAASGGGDEGEQEVGEDEDEAEPAEPLSEEDARGLFRDLLEDLGVSPFSPWDRLIEEGKMVDDPRYLMLSTTRARRDVWEEWSARKIGEIKERRAREEKKDPRIGYVSLLLEKATPKLYWPEFKRKYRKEAAMRDVGLADKDREKLYREHISRLKLAPSTLKADLTTLLRSLPRSVLHRQTRISALPGQILADLRYISLDAATRDPLIEAYIQTLPPPPDGGDGDGSGDGAGDGTQERKDRARREDRARQALEERRREVEDRRREEGRRLAIERQRLHAEELEIDRATREVGKEGLKAQLVEMGRRMDAAAAADN